MPLRPLPNPAAVFRSRILFTTLAPTSVPRKTSISYPLTVKGRTRHVPLWESNYHHPQAEDVPLALVTIDGVLGYSPFAHDHGPLNIAHVHHLATLLCVIFEVSSRAYESSRNLIQVMQDPRNKGRAICLYSSPDERLKSAAACLLATYLVRRLFFPNSAATTDAKPLPDTRRGANPVGYIPSSLGILLHPVSGCRTGGVRSRDRDSGCALGGMESADLWADCM